MTAKLEIVCTACGAEALLRREAVYEGFRKTGERLLCSACGYAYACEEAVPFKDRPVVKVFTEADRLAPVVVFDDDEKTRNCRHCVHYVVNPFTEWCGRHRRETAATEVCAQFTRRPLVPPAKPVLGAGPL
jgi:hypothetical protein